MSRTRKLLLIEDDPFIVEWVERLIEEHFPDIELMKVCSEREFLVRREKLAEEGLAGIILDVMLPWEDGVESDSNLFKEPRGTSLDAGIRVLNDVLAIPKFAGVPVLIHTVNDRSTVEVPRVPRQISFIRKDEPDHKLIHWINRLL